jgi:release factor glutamine methyltransferase
MGSRHLTEPAGTQLQDLLRAARERLGADGRLDAEVLLAHVLGCTRSMLLAHGERGVAAVDATRYRELIERRAAGEPVAYLTGTREFWSLPLAVTPAVLIPRPETELLVERVLGLGTPLAAKRREQALGVLELGTGSGAIALALASAAPAWSITAVDRSPDALHVARRNAQLLGLTRVEWLAGDWLGPVAGRRFELVCSNPPYLGAGDPSLAALRYEPLQALVAAHDGLGALHRIILDARAHLMPGGYLVLEHGSTQAAPVATALVAAGYARVVCHRDLAGHDRVTEAQWGH